jgi:phage terminase large subunit-like protein
MPRKTSLNGSSEPSRTAHKPQKPFTVDHFRGFSRLLVFENGQTREPEDFHLLYAEDVFAGHREAWLIVGEGNAKSTLFSELGLYGLHYAPEPWIPIGAASRDQAEIIHGQAAGFVRRTPEIRPFFRVYDGYRKIISKRNGGRGMKVYPYDPKTGDGVIPFPYALIDEPHRHPDMRLYGLWKGKLRKRGAQILLASTGGEPGSEFEDMREKIRDMATERHRDGAFLRAYGSGLVLHEYMVQRDEDCSDMEHVKGANPLSSITVEELKSEFGSPTMDLGDWKRFKCNRATRSAQTAITDAEWDGAQVEDEIPEGAEVDDGLDIAFKWDTTALIPLYQAKDYRLLGPLTELVPPRDGSSMHPDVIKDALFEHTQIYRVRTVVMDMERAADIAAWIEDELGITVIDRGQSNKLACADYEAFMKGLRNGTLRHTGCPVLRRHVLNAVARRLPGGDHRFDRASTVRQNVKAQDRRVIDGLTAAAMVVEHSEREPAKTSVYEERYAEPIPS